MNRSPILNSRFPISACVTVLLLAVTMEFAESRPLSKAVAETRADIAQAVDELNDVRDRIAQTRKPLAAEIEELRAEVKELRVEAGGLRRLEYQGEQEYETLKNDVAALDEELGFVEAVLSEYRRSLETRAGMAESAALAETLKDVDEDLSSRDDFADIPDAAAVLLKLAANRNRRNLGGMLINGPCLDDKGVEHNGTFAVLGPFACFAGEERAAGLVMSRLGSSRPALYTDVSGAAKKAIRSLTQGKEATVPVDVTAGDALKLAETKESLRDHVKAGGFVMIPLLAIAVLSIVLTAWKFVSLLGVRVEAEEDLDRLGALLHEDNEEAANELAVRLGEPLAGVLQEGIEHRNASKEHLEEIMHERVLSSIPMLERHLGTLAVLGGVAPLLGLLGTVTGMIHTFQLVTVFGTGDAKLLSGGISEALVTTECGLVIAIPVLLAHAYLARRARTIIGALERTIIGFVNRIEMNKNGGESNA